MAFNWSDHARALFSFCLPCLYSTRNDDDDDEHAHAARRDELESLLQDADFTDRELDADALSLHSHIGRQDGRKRVKRTRATNKRSITLFGFDLFGRPLPDLEDDERGAPSRVSRISSSTLDSDAAPLAEDAIAQLSGQTQSRRAADEERKARKWRRRQQKVAARLGAQDDAFEGFQGSGAVATPPDDFGAFQQAGREFVHIQGGGADDADADADFDAGSYVRTAAPRSDSGSGTRSASNTQPQPHHIPLPPSSGGSHSPTRPKRSKKSGKRSTATTSPATSQPRSPTSAVPAPHVDIASPSHDGFAQNDTFEGVPQDGDAFQASQALKRGLRLTGESVHGDQERFPSAGLSTARGSGRFPSPGLGRSGGFPSPNLGGRKNSLSMGGQGAFLARTGEDP